ncbi:CubicO group peptidase (beta-lactamase class C family) [Aeromicrobium panaciterrae]|uniref:CubicO group peptidase (Beta-lactamase class C family) n=1 Tax=Aeromicrobium panaciterrae TaxID=363861 RepID=A0ABU1UN95_9ACTN|nr:serine hydrolase domain-containing protein [Aeromicrobium panaciterrae]MDR7086632.1 CubicO group peptidase (beta-lactamase class C family) [Aeromicrobium panaciterrae]
MRFAAAVFLLLLAACSSDPVEPLVEPTIETSTPTPTPTFIYPGKDWAKAATIDANFEQLNTDLANARSTCFALIKDGELVYDAYWGGTSIRTTRPAYSITKSVTAILVGIAADEGKLALDDNASKYIPEWRRTAARNVTIRDLLSNTSGRHWDYNTDYSQMVRRAPDKTAFAIGLGQDAKPGTKWDYNNSAVQTLEAVLEKATGQDVAAYGKKRLLDPIGMRDTTWAHDAAGNTTTYSGIDSSCRDLARVGYLMMRSGAWKGKQLVSDSFVAEATNESSSQLNAAYGLLWWVNKPGRIVTIDRAAGFPNDKPPYRGQLAPKAPEDTFWALGYGSEYVMVIPSEGLVAVRMGSRPNTPEQLSYASFTEGVLKALHR